MIFEAIQIRHSTHTHHSLQLHTQHQQQQFNHQQLQHRFLEGQDLDQQQQHQHRLDGNGDDELTLKSLDFSLTKRLLAAVFFLLIIYAWKQYIEDGEESDTIYI